MAEKINYFGTDNQLEVSGDSTDTAGVLRIGLTGAYNDLGSTAGRHGLKFYFTSSATSGTSRGMYLRHKQTGAAGEADTLRVFQNVNANTTTCRGAHISMNFLATAGGSECSDLGTALTCTLHIPDIASWAPAGTLTSILAEIYSDGTNSDPAGLTELSFIRIANSGGTGKTDVDDDACIFSLVGFTQAGDASTAISSTSLTELPANSIGLQVKVDGTIYYLPLVLGTEWN